MIDDEDGPETTDAEFLRQIAEAIFYGRTGPQHLDQYHSDRLSRMSRQAGAAERLETDMRRYIHDRTFERRAQCLDAYAERAGLEPWKDRQ